MLIYLLYIFIALIPFSVLTAVLPHNMTVFPLLGVLIFFLWVIKFGIEKKPLNNVPELKWIAVFTAVLIAAWFTGSHVSNGIFVFATYFQMFFFFFLITQLLTEQKYFFIFGWVLIGSITIFSVILSIDYLYFIVNQGGFSYVNPEEIHGRKEGLNLDPNFSALYATLAISFVLYYIKIYKKLGIRILLLVCLSILFSAIILTHSMGGLIGLSSIMFLFLLFYKDFSTFKKISILVCMIPISILLYYFAPHSLETRVQHQYHNILSGNFETWGTGRGNLWMVSAKIIKENPLLGVGLGGYIEIMGREIYNVTGGKPKQAHNLYLAIATENGIIGLIVFLILVFSIMTKLLIEIKKLFVYDIKFAYIGCSIFLSLFSFLVQSMFLDTQQDKYLWLLLAIASIFIFLSSSIIQNNENRM